MPVPVPVPAPVPVPVPVPVLVRVSLHICACASVHRCQSRNHRIQKQSIALFRCDAACRSRVCCALHDYMAWSIQCNDGVYAVALSLRRFATLTQSQKMYAFCTRI